MKILMCFIVSYVSVAALASSEDVNAILSSQKLQSIESKLAQKGYELVSVTQTEARNPHIVTTNYKIAFHRGDINQVNTIELPAYVTDRAGKKEIGIPDLVE